MVTTLHRVNGIYESELAIRLELVPNTDQVIYLDPDTDPYDNEDGTAMLGQNRVTLNAVIGADNYDIGHVFSTGGGGIASLASVCGFFKAQGVTGLNQPIGDPFAVDYVAHEIGHQFGANHTFNGDSGSCAGFNRSAFHAYEPGSGSTIMAYAGICGNDNLQPNSDPYFHSESHQEIANFVAGAGGACAESTASTNMPPTVDAGPDFVIPALTPFTLTATGSDPDGHPVTYSWEQRDLGPAQDIDDPDNGSSPLFRFWPPSLSPSRVFPRLEDLLANTTAIGERLPTVSRTMDFRVTVRDTAAGGGSGAVASDDMQVIVDDASGPFQLTFPQDGVRVAGLESIVWNPAGTASGPVNASNVAILLSTNGGWTYPITLAASTPNTGSAIVELPPISATEARVKVEAVGNIFFDVSDHDFVIEAAQGLGLMPGGDVASTGPTGGPFAPTCFGYQVVNESASNLTWSMSVDQPWIDLSASQGILSVGETSTIDACLGELADSLPAGNYEAVITVTNVTEGVTMVRRIDLGIEPSGGRIRFAMPLAEVFESAPAATAQVERVSASAGMVSVAYRTLSDTAVEGADFVSSTGSVSWSDGEAAPKPIVVPIVNDFVVEPTEQFQIEILDPVGDVLMDEPRVVDVAIVDEDADDFCVAATRIVRTPYTDVRSTAGATSTLDPSPTCQLAFGNGVWYRIRPPVDGTLMVDTSGSDFDTTLALYQGPCTNLVEVDCDDDGGVGVASRLLSPVSGDAPYVILAGGFLGETGQLHLAADYYPVPGALTTNDECHTAISMLCTPFVDTRPTTASTTASNEIASCADGVGGGVWYSFDAVEDGWLTLDTVGSDFDTAVAIFTGDCGALVEIGCNDDAGAVTTSRLDAAVTAGVRYLILVGGPNDARGSLVLSASFQPRSMCVDQIADGDFEEGDPWANWTLQGSSRPDLDTAICSTTTCATNSTRMPLAGDHWTLFSYVNHSSTVGQVISLPMDQSATLRFGLWISEVSFDYKDTLGVWIDDTNVATYDEPTVAESAYHMEAIPLDAFADGNDHTLRFVFTSPALFFLSVFQIDQIELWTCERDADQDGFPDATDPDDDQDGIWDVWEWVYGLDATIAADAQSDIDADGYTALEEFIADTVPTNANSALFLDIEPAGNPAAQRLRFDASTERAYFLDSRTNLTVGGWTSIQTNLPGAGAGQSITVSNQNPAAFYRLGVTLPP